MALLLIKAEPHWMDKLSQSEVQERSSKDAQFEKAYSARYQPGDVVEVREDDAPFGRKECLPNFLVIKVPGTAKENMYLMEAERQGDDIQLRRKYKFDYKKKISAARLAEIEQAPDMLIDEFDKSTIEQKSALRNRSKS